MRTNGKASPLLRFLGTMTWDEVLEETLLHHGNTLQFPESNKEEEEKPC